MDIEHYRNFCLSLAGVSEGFPFDSQTLVFKVGGKMFSIFDVITFDGISLKCAPEKAIALREQFREVIPGYHLNKNHWNTVNCNGSISDKLLIDWTLDSYNLVLNSLPKRIKNTLI